MKTKLMLALIAAAPLAAHPRVVVRQAEARACAEHRQPAGRIEAEEQHQQRQQLPQAQVRHSEHRCTAAIAPVRALCQIEQIPWGPERPVKCLQVSQELKR